MSVNRKVIVEPSARPSGAVSMSGMHGSEFEGFRRGEEARGDRLADDYSESASKKLG